MTTLNTWFNKWAHCDLVGGIPGREADDLNHIFYEDLLNADYQNLQLIGGKTDMSKFFDRASPFMALNVLRKLGLDAQTCGILSAFYSDLVVWFTAGGLVTQQSHARKSGILQGCPFAILMVSALATCLCHYVHEQVQHPSLHLGIYIDDRLMWANNFDTFAEAVQATYYFDTTIFWVWNMGKGCTFARNPDDHEALEQLDPYVGPVVNTFVNLGTHIDVAASHCQAEVKGLRPKTLAIIDRQLHRISIGIRGSKSRRAHYVAKHIIPKIKWGTQWNGHTEKNNYDLEFKVEKCILDGWHNGRSRSLVWMAQLGHTVSPRFAHDFEAVLATIRRIRKVRLFDHHTSLANTNLFAVAVKWHWQNVPNEPYVFDTAVGRLDLQEAAKSTIVRAAIYGWQYDMMSRDNRIPEIELTAHIAAGRVPSLNAHRERLLASRCFLYRSTGHGGLVHGRDLHKTKTIQYQNAPNCSCGETLPTRRHWMYACPHYPLPPTLRSYNTEAEHGLALSFVTLPKPMPSTIAYRVPYLARKVQSIRDLNQDVVAATDAGALEQAVAGLGIALAAPDGHIHGRWCSWMAGADQTSGAGELETLTILIEAAKLANTPVYVIIDNLNVYDGFTALLNKDFHYPKFSFGRWRRLEIAIGDLPHRAEWVPSHGKKPKWAPKHTVCTAAVCRQLNDEADRCASSALERAARFSDIGLFLQQCKSADSWSSGVLDNLYAAAKDYLLQNDATRSLVDKWLCEPR